MMKTKKKPKPPFAKLRRKMTTTKLSALVAATNWARNEQTKLGLWMPAKLLQRLYHLADIKCRTKTAELITAIESHLERYHA